MPAKKTTPKRPVAAKAAAQPPQQRMSDLDLVRGLASILSETGLSEIEFDQHGTKVRVSKASAGQVHMVAAPAPVHHAIQAAPQPAAQLPAIAAPAAESKPAADHAGVVKSPMVGTAYLAASPGAAPFIEVGTQVKAGQTLLIIEAMKTMNQIPSPVSGRVVQIHITNADPVEFGEALVTIE